MEMRCRCKNNSLISKCILVKCYYNYVVNGTRVTVYDAWGSPHIMSIEVINYSFDPIPDPYKRT